MKKKVLAKGLASMVLWTLILFCIPGCPMRTYYNCPNQQPNTQWISEDGRIFIDSDENGGCYGIIDINGQKVPVGMSFGGHTNVDLFGVINDKWTKKSIESWSCDCYYQNEFKVTVSDINKNHYFNYEANEKIKFRKLDEREMINFNLSNYANNDYNNNIQAITDTLTESLSSYKDIDNIEEISVIIQLNLIMNDIDKLTDVRFLSADYTGFVIRVADEKNHLFNVTYNYSNGFIEVFSINM